MIVELDAIVKGLTLDSSFVLGPLFREELVILLPKEGFVESAPSVVESCSCRHCLCLCGFLDEYSAQLRPGTAAGL